MTPEMLQRLIDRENADLLLKEVEKLPTLPRAIMICTLNGVDFGEYAELTFKNYGTCKSSYNQALQRLKRSLRE